MMRCLLSLLSTLLTYVAFAQSPSRLHLVSATPNVYTNQDYSPWLNDDLNHLVQGTYGNNDPNNRYADVNVKLAKKSILSKISLYDHQGQFPAGHLTYIYVLNENDSTFIGTFNGQDYLTFVDYPVNNLLADAIVIRKYGNDIPQKVRAYGTALPEPSISRLSIISAVPNIYTNQDYSPWLTDDLDDLVQGTYGNNDPNNRYVDVHLQLASKSIVSRLSLYDHQGQFPAGHLSYIYLVNGNDSTFVGTFDGASYLTFINYPVNKVLAEAIVIRKFGNDFPQKVRAYGYDAESLGLISSIIDFPVLPFKSVTDSPFALQASSNNMQEPIQFSSSDTSVVSIANTAGNWIATMRKPGVAEITASQSGNATYLTATAVKRTLTVTTPPFITASDSVQRIPIAAIVPNFFTGQDYSPWLNDNLDSLVLGTYGSNDPNNRYVDVAVWLAKRSLITKVSLYDYYGQFPQGQYTHLYALKGAAYTYLGTFDGANYLTFINFPVDSVLADALIIRKYGNDIPQKVRVYGIPLNSPAHTRLTSVIAFPPMPNKTNTDAAFNLTASSTNNQCPLSFQSTDSTIVSVAQVNGVWKALPRKPGTVSIIATQTGNNTYIPAMPVFRTLTITANEEPVNPVQAITAPKIPLSAQRWYTLDNNISLDQLTDGIASPQVSVVKGGKMRPIFESYYPLRDGETMEIEAIRMFDGSGMEPDSSKNMHLYVITDTWERKLIARFSGQQYLTWVGFNPAHPEKFYLDSMISNARYLLLKGSGMFPTEMELFGNYHAGTAPTQAVKKPIKLKDMFAVNGFEWDFENLDFEIPADKLKAAKTFSGFRHYIEWNKIEGNEGLYTFNPTRSGGWNYDAIYEKCKEEGIEVLGCIKGIPDWMVETYPDIPGWRDSENVPTRYGMDLADPHSYIEQAKMAFQYAARYGSNKNVNPALLSVNSTPRWNYDPINVVKIGMDVVKYMECDNERDKTWKHFGYQTGREYAANLSAWYDGHKNTMGPGVGVKNADPNMKVVMCGIASVETDYIRGMVDWCKEFRGYNPDGTVNLCWDVVNYHAYANDGKTSQTGTYTRGTAPEIGGLAEVADDFVQMAHEVSKDMEVWVTETGYDLSPGSPLRAIPIGNKTAEQVQADWILRTSLLYARHGVKRVFFYLMYDQSTMDNYTQFATSGLLRNTDLSRKPAGDFIFQTNQLFGEYTFQESLNADPVVDRYQLNGQSMYTLYIPDETDRKANYTLNLGNADSAYVYTPKAGSDKMELQKLKLLNGQLNLQVSETPLFVQAIQAPRLHNEYAWTGAKNAFPDSVGNWRNTTTGALNELPDEHSDLIVPGGLSRYPSMQNVLSARNLFIESGASWNLNGQILRLSGNLNNSGHLAHNGNLQSSVIFEGKNAVQVFSGNSVQESSQLGRLVVRNIQGLSLAGGEISVSDYVKVESGHIASNGLLHLKATEQGYASLLALPSGASVTGEVSTELYFTGGSLTKRNYRGFSSPINDALTNGPKSIQQLKQSVIITGNGGEVNGFDPGENNFPTLSHYNEPANNASSNFTAINSLTTPCLPGTGLLFFYRGNRDGYSAQTAASSPKVNAPFATPENTVVKLKGVLNQGEITVPLTYTYHDGEDAQNGLNLVGNPYPCAIDWRMITRTNVHNLVQIIKPEGGVATYSEGVTSNAGQITMRYIQPGQGFYVQASKQDSSFLTFTEACKVSGQAFLGRFMNANTPLDGLPNATLGQANSRNEYLRISLTKGDQAEETVIVLNPKNNCNYALADGDAPYLGMGSLYLSSLTADGKEMTINFLPAIEKQTALKLRINTSRSGIHSLQFNELPGTTSGFWLNDHYLKRSIQVFAKSEYSFSIDKNNAKTYGSERFSITTQSPVENLATISIYPNPVENTLHIRLADTDPKNIRFYDLSGRLIKQLQNAASTASVDIKDWAPGVYVVKIGDAGNNVLSSSKFVKK